MGDHHTTPGNVALHHEVRIPPGEARLWRGKEWLEEVSRGKEMAYPGSPEPDLERLMKGLCGDTYEVTGGHPVKPGNVYPQGQPSWLLRKKMI